MRAVKPFAIGVSVFALILSSALAGDDGPWMDPANCDMCKNVTQQEGLMEHMKSEYHKIATGMMSVTTVDPAFAKAYANCKTGMKDTQERAMAGEEVHLCQCCTDIMSMAAEGAQIEQVETEAGDVLLITSTDQEMIDRIHTHAQKTIDFMASMMGGEDEEAAPADESGE